MNGNKVTTQVIRIAAAVVIGIMFAGAAMAQGFPLRDSAEKRGFYIGAAVAVPPFYSEAQYQNTLKREFNIIVGENAFKWTEIHPGKDTYNFTDTDALVAFAQANGMAVRGHTLVWYQQIPSWVTSGNFTRDEAINLLHDHINTVMGRYKGQILAWDVVNEAIDDATPGLRTNSFWYQTIGPDYIAMAFQFAHEADPAAKLYYNDYGAEGLGQKSDAVYNLLRDLKAAGVPVDGVGWQMHVTNGTQITDDNRQNAARLAALGLDLMITELDVRVQLPAKAKVLKEQATSYNDILAFCLNQPNCKALLMWGFTDKYSWVPGFFQGQGDALIFDANYQPKPAYTAMQATLEAGLQFTPEIVGAVKSGKQLIVTGESFATGAQLLINGAPQKKTSNDASSPTTMLVAKKAGKIIQSGDRLQVRNPDGSLSNEVVFP